MSLFLLASASGLGKKSRDLSNSSLETKVKIMDENSDSNITTTAKDEGCRNVQDLLLPIANIGRIMKQVLPSKAKISKEAKQTMQECASEFIAFITGEASDKCRKENRQTLSGEDICHAMKLLGLDKYACSAKSYLQKYREHCEKSEAIKNTEPMETDMTDMLQIYCKGNQHS
ncbi:transcriptional activator hap3-like [Phalaenopsis equestris]|uniref:transcriptional activator hap3-like n=1 Tax=Phalaenopsis equestris TaxID=78828 RepID=UPI0009E56F3C|nr:transcriptional activator hap3-like [Phalaenopsis equestris]